MNVLVDTSVWVAHFRNRNEHLAQLLLDKRVLTHPLVRLELSCGTPPEPRRLTLTELGLLPASLHVGWSEVMAFIERRKLYGLGCGVVDLTLLASTLVTPDTQLWTLDKRLGELAAASGVLYSNQG
ncbi:twitching motility protein PilT [Betaproteobacteria bacterium]|nr:twitching motility protein PilT [Betaproteobacteria bacterium]GHU47517.1 twitching motility protein PilT [Betaproteobacteria bacterium]